MHPRIPVRAAFPVLSPWRGPTALPGPGFSPGARQDQTTSFQSHALKKKKGTTKKPK